MLRVALLLCVLAASCVGTRQVGLDPFDDMWDLPPANSIQQQQRLQQMMQPQLQPQPPLAPQPPSAYPRFASAAGAPDVNEPPDPFAEAFDGPFGPAPPAFIQQAAQQQQQQQPYPMGFPPQQAYMMPPSPSPHGFAQPAYPPLTAEMDQQGYIPRWRNRGAVAPAAPHHRARFAAAGAAMMEDGAEQGEEMVTEAQQQQQDQQLQTEEVAITEGEAAAEQQPQQQEQDQEGENGVVAPPPQPVTSASQQQKSVQQQAEEEEEDEPMDEMSRLKSAMEAINYDIMDKVNQVRKNEEWASKVQEVLRAYEKKLSNVAKYNAKTRREIRKLLNKKKLIKNLILQKELENKIYSAKQDLDKVTSALETVTSKSQEIEQAKAEIEKTIVDIHAQLERLRNQQNEVSKQEGSSSHGSSDSDASDDTARLLQRKTMLQRLQSDIKELERREAALQEKKRELEAAEADLL